MKNYIDVNKDKLDIVFDHASELEDGDTILIADKTCVWECQIMKVRHTSGGIGIGFDDGRLPIIREDLCVISIIYQDENGVLHYDNEIVTHEQAKIAQQFNETVEIILQNK